MATWHYYDLDESMLVLSSFCPLFLCKFTLSSFLFPFFFPPFWLGLSRNVELLIAGLAIKVCLYDESDPMPVHTEEKLFYTEDDYRNFLSLRRWSRLREFDGYRNIDNMDDLRPGAIYHGVS
jgi:hypothetical protein